MRPTAFPAEGPPRAIYVVGPGRGGSTLLERVLNTSPQAFALGEFHCLWRLPRERILCACGAAFDRCDFWQAVMRRSALGDDGLRDLRRLEWQVARSGYLLRQGLNLEPEQLEKGRQLALRSLEQLDGLRVKLQTRLEQELARAEERWGGSGSGGEPGGQFAALRLAAQRLADQLSEVEELEGRIEQLLAPAPTPGANSSEQGQ